MKKAILGMLILTALLICLSSCAPTISQEEYNALQSNLENAQRAIDELTENLATLRADYTDSQTDYEGLQTNYEDLQASYNNLLAGVKKSTLGNPTWSELKDLLERDDTDTLLYVEDSFDCSGFAITLRDRAWKYGIRCAYVEVGFFEEKGHALNAFETIDKGLIYVDNVKGDHIAYVEINQPYGTIHLDGVKSDYIACSGSPSEFWEPLTYSTHPNPFSYDYYIDYQRRTKFYIESIDAYNKAVDEYNNGSTDWTYPQLTSWHDNLEALEQDLGPIFYEPIGTVKSVEAYWN